ncbi:hypothetical protein J2X36_004674 [Methylobacterium sp. BE186]|uniref:hypothetical protein n=1 Tax=Methylobacterium sp. BE186 TaxID=2817715 RepID=UPI002865EE82|nr:hypothetical protein [Methylobacterium sp. BE186]MDR7039896.1 hypothetical protein [Methylobacterium sp. BE186]
MPSTHYAAALLMTGLFLSPASASEAVTGIGGGPETTITAPSGQTVPPGAASAPTSDPTERTRRQRELDPILDGICAGCR